MMTGRKGATSCPRAMAVAARPISPVCQLVFRQEKADAPPLRVCIALLTANMPHNWSIMLEMRAPSDDSTCLHVSQQACYLSSLLKL